MVWKAVIARERATGIAIPGLGEGCLRGLYFRERERNDFMIDVFFLIWASEAGQKVRGSSGELLGGRVGSEGGMKPPTSLARERASKGARTFTSLSK